jgi:hypothetical protein
MTRSVGMARRSLRSVKVSMGCGALSVRRIEKVAGGAP